MEKFIEGCATSVMIFVAWMVILMILNYPIMLLWNYIMPILGIPTFTFWQMFGFAVLVRCIVPTSTNYNTK